MAQKKQKQKRLGAKTSQSMKYISHKEFMKTVPQRGVSKAQMARLKKHYGDLKTSKVVKKVSKKSLARKLVGKTLAKAIPGAGGAMIAHDVMRAGSKKGCIKRGGKWVGGKCQIAKKTRTKASGPDPRFAKSRSKKK